MEEMEDAVNWDGPAEVVVEIAHAFGSHCSTDLRDPVIFGDEAGHYLIFPVGRHIAFRHLDTGEMNFVLEMDKVEAVTAVAVSKDKNFLAVAETVAGENLSQVTIYDLKAVGVKPIRSLENLSSGQKRLACLAFSHDSK